MNQTHQEAMADVRDMYMVHIMFRRELGLLPQLVRGVHPGDAKRADVVGAHAALLCRQLHLHHEGEDLFLWPLLAERGGAEAAAVVPAMQTQHHAIEQAYEAVVALLPGWRRTGHDGAAVADAVEQLRAAAVEHMALEEAEILPLAQRYVTAAEWAKLGEHGLNDTPKKDLPLIFGMGMYEGDKAVIKAVLAHAPLPARLLMPIVGPRLYRSYAKRVHGTATPPRIGANAS
ncbi:hemerythrin domain-containing protein [Micromonospora sp. CA-249363]|uniref:hemerythrin domain-containing protein n=1 Tax=Micromonospora sp. CA-249363 TaxID=3239963 RepID=UPI003D90A535